MENSDQFEEVFPLHAYLSYRCKIDRDREARDKLKALCLEQNITLRYDESETEEGDSLIEFMEDLTSARCVFLFLSPEYFQSAYTLFELVRINEWADLDQSFILPLRLPEAMVTYQRTAAKDYFDGNEAVRNELVRLLKKYNVNHDNLWQRIDKAWETIIYPHLDRLNVSLENANADVALGKLLGKTKATVIEAINKSTNEFQENLINKITAILNLKHINADDKFKEELELALPTNNDASHIATQLVKKTAAGKAITILTRILKEKKSLLDKTEWQVCFIDAERLCGWLLLNSVDPIWWFHNEIKLNKTAKTSISSSVALHDNKYIEVVISRTLFKAARYALYDDGQPKPAGNIYDVMCFEGHSPKAKKEESLIRIYKDLLHVSPSPSSEIDILKKIINRATAISDEIEKPIYYLVSSDYLAMWESMAEEDGEMKKLAGCLQFICCDKPAKSDERQASSEDQSQLLDKVAYLLSFEN